MISFRFFESVFFYSLQQYKYFVSLATPGAAVRTFIHGCELLFFSFQHCCSSSTTVQRSYYRYVPGLWPRADFWSSYDLMREQKTAANTPYRSSQYSSRPARRALFRITELRMYVLLQLIQQVYSCEYYT